VPDLAWREEGGGEPLLLLNGYAATKDDWDPSFTARLAARMRVICPDNRGIGESQAGWGGEELSAGGMATDCLELLDDLDIRQAAVAGWSMGGFVAQEVAARAPERVRALVLMSTDHGGPGAIERDADADARLTDHSGTPDEQARRLLGLLFPPPDAQRVYAQFGELVAAARAALDPALLAAQEEAMRRWHAEPANARLEAIAAPAAVATGTLDEVIPPANAELLAARLRDSWLARFPGGGHAFMAQYPERLADWMLAFLAA
jgi:pimeloyl-ACP methyl ester carboxylesterase